MADLTYDPKECLLDEALKDYQEPLHGVVSNRKNPEDHSSDNAMLFTATALVLLHDWNARSGLIPRWGQLPAQMKTFASLTTVFRTGDTITLDRYPGQKDRLESHDNIRGLCVWSWLYAEGPYAGYVRNHGIEHSWWFDNTGLEPMPSTSLRQWLGYGLELIASWLSCRDLPAPTRPPLPLLPWLGRFPGFTSLVRACAHEKLDILEQLWAAFGFVADIYKKDPGTSGKCLQYLSARVLWGQYKIVDLAIIAWWWRLQKLYPGQGMTGVYRIYFGEDHPLTRWGWVAALKGLE